MDRQFLLNQLESARETRDENLFLELLEQIYSDKNEDYSAIVEISDKVLDILEEWGWLDRMIEYASALVNNDPSDAQCKTELACFYYKKGYLDKAEILLSSSLELKENPLARYYLDKIQKSR